MGVVVRSTNLNVDKVNDLRSRLMLDIENTLNQLSIMYRVFGRTKTQISLNAKLNNPKKEYVSNQKMIEDIIGIRITLYFSDDIDIVHDILKKQFKCREESTSKDVHKTNQFEAVRNNHVFEIPEKMFNGNKNIDDQNVCDCTFEVQLRTIFSEGWHEVEHDFRYKNKEHWQGLPIYDRQLNGLLATLETADWGMLQLFNDLTFNNYKKKEWNEMIKHKFRIRFQKDNLSDEIVSILNQNTSLAKKIYRYSRQELLSFLFLSKLNIPLTLNNIVFIINELGDNLNDQEIREFSRENFRFINAKIDEAVKEFKKPS